MQTISPLSSFEILLRNLDGPLPIQAVRAKALNGLFYTEMGRKYPAWVDRMHASSKPLPFSLSLLFDDGAVRGIRVDTLEAETGAKVAEIWGSLADRRAEIRLGSAQMVVTSLRLGQPGNAAYDQLFDQSPAASGLSLRFITPMRLKHLGHETLLPIPQAVWGSYARRWEAYSAIPLPPEFSRWVEWQVTATQLKLETFYAYMEKEVEWKGVAGEVEFQAQLDAKDLPASRLTDYLRFWQALASLSEYSGTGEKVVRGMGRTVKTRVFGFQQEDQPVRMPEYQDLARE